MTKTEWFDADVKPVHAGLYERGFASVCTILNEWDGKKWLPVKFGDENIRLHSMWRGLSEETDR